MTQEEKEKLTDILDQASEIETRTREGLIADIQARCKPQQMPLPDGSYEFPDCDECGNEIGEGRLKVAAKNLWCVICASAKEKRAGRY
jgi:RNA polymerase-binding transcription factor DksA